MKFEVRNRWTGAVQFTAEIECDENAGYSIKLGLAVRWAYKSGAVLSGAVLSDAVLRGADLSGAVLSGAVLRGADLRGADLSGADLSGADLRDAVLSGADLRGADLRSFKADFWMTLTENPNEVDGVIDALKAGRVNGSQYSGECACLIGTIANVRGVSYKTIPHRSSNPAEVWFAMIKTGDKPGDDSGGGFAAGKAVEWAEEWKRARVAQAGE